MKRIEDALVRAVSDLRDARAQFARGFARGRALEGDLAEVVRRYRG